MYCVVYWRVLCLHQHWPASSLPQSLPVNGTRSGYIRFRRWRISAESGLAKRRVQVSFYTSTLKIEYQETELAFYTMEWEDNKRIKEVKNPRLIETGTRRATMNVVDART